MENEDKSKNTSDENKISSRIYKKWGMIWDFETQYPQTLFFLLSFSLFMGIGYVTNRYSFDLTFWISEFDKEVIAHFSVKDIVDLMYINLIFPIFAVWVRNSVNNNYNTYFNNNNSNNNNNNNNHNNWDNYLYYIFMGLMIFGNTSHVLANNFTHLLQTLDPTLRDTSLFYSIYFWDEYFGHLALVLGMYGMALTNLAKQIKVPLLEYKMSPDKWIHMILTGIGLGVGISLAMMEGQSNPIFLLLNVVLLITLLVYVVRSKNRNEINGDNWSIKNHPVIVLFILESIFFIISSVVWGLVYGIMDHYPYFYQNGGERLW